MTEEMQDLLDRKSVLYDKIDEIRKREATLRVEINKELEVITIEKRQIERKLREICTHKNGDGTDAKQKRIDFREIQLYGSTELWYYCTICGKLLQ